MQAKWVIAATTSIFCISAACTNDRTDIHNNTEKPQDQPEAVAESHALYDERLRDLMSEMQRTTNENWPEKMDDEHAPPNAKDTAFSFDKAEPLADALAKSADRIPDTVAHLVMIEADRRAFRAQSETLRDQALRLSTAAKKRDTTEMRTVLQSIDATCRACHARFLDVSGPLSRL